MSTESFFSHLTTQFPAAVVADRTVHHFGDVAAEQRAAAETAAVMPLAACSRVRVTGEDRARFLHNFCTHNINDLLPGHARETFFTDVKAKIVAHGYIAVAESSIEIWTLSSHGTCDDQQLLNHLDRYIITDDVTLTDISPTVPLAVTGPQAVDVLAAAGQPVPETDQTFASSAAAAALQVRWNGQPVVLLCSDDPQAAWQSLLNANAQPAGIDLFHDLRIREGFPLIGQDLTSEHMAPEADRNRIAISYTKGCYLGQEPIARLDALGHVNRKLCRCDVVARISDMQETDSRPLVSSCSAIPGSQAALAVLPVKAIDTEGTAVARLSDGSVVRLKVHADA